MWSTDPDPLVPLGCFFRRNRSGLVRLLRGEVHADVVAGLQPVTREAEVGTLGELQSQDVLIKIPGPLQILGDQQIVVQLRDWHGFSSGSG